MSSERDDTGSLPSARALTSAATRGDPRERPRVERALREHWFSRPEQGAVRFKGFQLHAWAPCLLSAGTRGGLDAASLHAAAKKYTAVAQRQAMQARQSDFRQRAKGQSVEQVGVIHRLTKPKQHLPQAMRSSKRSRKTRGWIKRAWGEVVSKEEAGAT